MSIKITKVNGILKSKVLGYVFRSVRIIVRVVLIPRDWLYCLFNGVQYDLTWRFFGLPCIYTNHGHGIITIGKHFVARSQVRSNSIGVIQPVLLGCAPDAILIIGDCVGISGSTVASSELIKIGNRVLIGSGCLITDSDAHPTDLEARMNNDELKIGKAPICIEDDVFIGARAIILKGVNIGKASVIGSGAVVTSNVPPYCIAAGNPAKVIGHIKKSASNEPEILRKKKGMK